MTRSRRLRALALSAASGLLLLAAGEPFDVAPLAWVALTPLAFAILKERRWRWTALYGFVCGVVYFSAHLSWIFLFGWMAHAGLVVVMAAWWAAAGLAGGIVRRLPLSPVLIAGAFTAAELGRDRFPWSGFGWGTPGLSQVGMPGVRWLAGTVGASGLTFLVMFAGVWVADRIVSGHPAWGSVVLVAAVLGPFVVVDAVRFAPDGPGRPVRVAVVQGNVPRPMLSPFEAQRMKVFADHVDLTRRLAGRDDLDLVVWGEDAIGDEVPGWSEQVSSLAQSVGAPMIVGRSETAPDAAGFYNLMDQFDASGRHVDTYIKRHPVPFGEYVPLDLLRRHVRTLDQVGMDMLRGEEANVFVVGGVRIATPICFESVFARDVRAFARNGSELVVYATNDSSFERTQAPVQHLAHARMRAAEMRQWGVQAALSGLTAVIAPDGRLIQRTELFEPQIVEAELRARRASSLYSRTGDLFAGGWMAGTALALLIYLGLIARGLLRQQREPATIPLGEPVP